MRHFPAFLDLQDRPVALFGRGPAALGKARLLTQAGAIVHVFTESPLDDDLADLAKTGRLRHDTEPAHNVDLTRFALVISCAGDPIDTGISARARVLNIPVNVVDRPELCSFIVPSIVDRGAVVAAVSTGGESPVIARRLRERIEALLPAGIGALAALLGRHRAPVMAKLDTVPARRGFWESIVDGPIGEALLAGDAESAERLLAAAIARLPETTPGAGVLHIVGAGPGDPELLTLKALRVLQDADIILHDVLVPAAILDLARRDAERVAIGRRAGTTGIGQTAINRRLVDEVRRGRRVVRLKGGDPFVFGRGGEEAEAVRAAGLDVHVIPGITAALGLAAEAQIPLTHREDSASLTFVSAARRADGEAFDASRLPVDGTLAVYMGRREAATVARDLIAAGRAPDTAVAVIVAGARPERQSVVGRLDDLGHLAAGPSGDGPALLIIGDVVRRSALWAIGPRSSSLAAE